MNSVSDIYQPVKWEQHMPSSEPVAFAAPEHKKVSDIKLLHPFKYKVIYLLFWPISLCHFQTLLHINPKIHLYRKQSGWLQWRYRRLTNHGGIMHARSVSKQQDLFVILLDALSLSAELLVCLSQGQQVAHSLLLYDLYYTYKDLLLICHVCH